MNQPCSQLPGQSLDEMIDEIRRLRANVLPRGRRLGVWALGGPWGRPRRYQPRFAPGSVAERLRGGGKVCLIGKGFRWWRFACALFIYIYIYMSQISWSLLKVTIVKFPSCRIAQKVNLSQRSKQVHALSHRWIADFAGLSVESRLRLDRIRWGPLFLPKFLPPTKGVTVQGMHRSVISMFARGFWRGKTGKTENSDWVEKTPKHSC